MDILIIGGLLVGGIMIVGIIVVFMGWEVNFKVMMIGMINFDGMIGFVGGIFEKVLVVVLVGVKFFFIFKG